MFGRRPTIVACALSLLLPSVLAQSSVLLPPAKEISGSSQGRVTEVVLTKDSVVQFLNRFEESAAEEVLTVDAKSATATYTYNWEGSMDGRSFRIPGRGTRVLVLQSGRLQIIHAHLSRYPKP